MTKPTDKTEFVALCKQAEGILRDLSGMMGAFDETGMSPEEFAKTLSAKELQPLSWVVEEASSLVEIYDSAL